MIKINHLNKIILDFKVLLMFVIILNLAWMITNIESLLNNLLDRNRLRIQWDQAQLLI